MSQRAGLVQVDWGAFDPWAITAMRHHRMQHPLLQMDARVGLRRRLDARGCVRTHSNDAPAGTPFNNAPRMHRKRAGTLATRAGIAEARAAWMSLFNVQTDPLYRGLVDEVFGDLAPGLARRDPGMCYRGGWIFVTSPRTVTPYHFDTEHGFILQIRGRKALYVWEPHDTVAASELARDLLHASHRRDPLRWDESLRARARVCHFAPGDGAYRPSTAPRLVENGDDPSVTISLTFYSDSTRRIATLHRVHQRLRERGIELPPVGERPLLDAALHAGSRGLLAAKPALHHAIGKTVLADDSPYAHALRN